MTSLDELWNQHGPRLGSLAERELGNDAADVRAACYHTLLRAGRAIAAGDPVPPGDAAWGWLEEIAQVVCQELRAGELDTAAVPAGPLPGALPEQLRTHLQLRAAKQAELAGLESRADPGPVGRAILRLRHRVFGQPPSGFPGLVVAPLALAFARRVADAATRSGRSLARRFDGFIGLAGEPASRLAHALAAVSLSDVVAVAAAAALFGLGGPSLTPATAASAGGEIASASDARPYAVPQTALLPGAVLGGGDPRGTSAGAGGPAGAGEPGPRLRSNHDEVLRHPVGEESRDGYDTRESTRADIEVDATGDGESDVRAGSPTVHIDCPPEEERGVLTSAICPHVGLLPGSDDDGWRSGPRG